MRTYIMTERMSIPIPTELELYLIMTVIVFFVMWVVME